MIPYLEALEIIRREGMARRLGSVQLQSREALGRVLAEDLSSAESLPEFDNSAVDGFAIRSEDLKRELVSERMTLPVAFRVLPGETPKAGSPGAAVEIMTGAPMPAGAGFDLLLKVEDVLQRRSLSGGIEIEFSPDDASSLHVRRSGTDYRAGDRVATAGQKVDPPTLMALAALGIREVGVFRKPVVWIISTGNELVEPFSEPSSGAGRRPGQIRNSTAPFLQAELERLGCEVRGPVLVSDEVEAGAAGFEKVLQAALLEEVDLVISTGAVSMGVHDIVREGVLSCGGNPGFHRVAIRPGKPVLFASFPSHPKTLFFGLPGNPVSTAVGVEFFVRPWLRALQGRPEPPVMTARLSARVSKPRELRCFCNARWEIDREGRSVVGTRPGQASFMIHSYRGANAWAILPEGEGELEAGAVVEVRAGGMLDE